MENMLHDRMGLEYLAELMHQRGIRHLIISPGSRNAPIIDAFCKKRGFECKAIVDERSAAFFALGMAQQLQQPVAIACTSGTAVLNFAPAIAEAYYQRIPLLVLTADRPVEFIDQGDGQTIRQQNIFSNYIRKSIQIPQTIKTNDDLWYANRLASEALNAAVYPVAGPVHINLPFSEPLYGVNIPKLSTPKDFQVVQVSSSLSAEALNEMKSEWERASKKMIITGQFVPDDQLQVLLTQAAKDPGVVVLTETTSNLHGPDFIAWTDRCLAAMPIDTQSYAPELLVTMGGAVVSKRIKSWLRKVPVKSHWHVDIADLNMDTYQHLSRSIPMRPAEFLEQLLAETKPSEGDYAARWKDLSDKARRAHEAFLQDCPYSDLKIFNEIVRGIPQAYEIHLANSTPVRYAQLFEYPHAFRFDSNRGVSGIDGSISTAAGAALVSGKHTLMITGDLGFFYDSNALWNKHLPKNLKIIMINNGGGGIFRYIDGPDQTGVLEEFFEASHNTSAEYIAKAFGLDYFVASDLYSLQSQLSVFFRESEKLALLEIMSPATQSAAMLRAYFTNLGAK
jgi:2-succinyl-5-enolpyruvyl-6-hydroxy-3-cyclohexene-1-carboxylate synthase